jgi:hypothetical protein
MSTVEERRPSPFWETMEREGGMLGRIAALDIEP